MTKLELQNKIATIEKNISLIKTPELLANLQKNLKDAKEKLAALEKGTPAPAPSGGSSELEKLYAQREVLKKNLSSENPVVQKTAKTALPKVEARIAELEGASPAPAPSPAPAKRGRKPKAEAPAGEPKKRGRKPKAETPAGEPKKRGRKPKAETPAEEKPKIRRGRKPKAETPAEVPVAPVRRGRKPKAPTETPAKAPAKRGRPALPKGARSQEVSIDSLTKLGNAIVMFCNENGIESPTLADVKEILYILDKRKALRYAKGGKISKSGSYLSKWQIKQILTDGGMKIGSDEILSGVWLKKKGRDVAQMRVGGEVGYFVIDDDILDSGKSVMLGNRRISAKNKKFQGVFQGKMVGGVMKVYDYDDEMWKAVNPNEWQQAYAEGGEVGGKKYFLNGYSATAYFDTYESGEGDMAGGWDEKLNKIFDTKDALIKYISENITSVENTENDFDWEVGDGRYIVTSVLCTYDDYNGYYPANESERNLWKQGKKELFNVDYFIYVTAAIPTDYAKGGGVGNFTLADYKENEETNNHSENALMLVKMYGTQDEINEVERLIKKGEREFGFSMEDYRRLYEISNKYYKHLVEASKRNVDNYAEGGGIGSVFSRAKGFGKIALDKGVALGKSAKQKTQKAIHESKKKIALDVLWEVKKKLAKGRDENIAIEKAFIIVKKKYENGGGIYAEGGGVEFIHIYNGDDVVYSAKNLLMAKLWVIKNWKKYDELIVEDSYGDSIVITKEDTLKDIDFLFSN